MAASTIETNRLIIRSFRDDDWEPVFSYMSDPEVTRWLPEDVFSPGDAKQYVKDNSGDLARSLAVIEKASDRLVGHMAFYPASMKSTFEIGWVYGRRFQGLGYATEAAKALLYHAFAHVGCHRVIATCQPENSASWKVMEKVGMRREGLSLQCIHRGDGVWWDEYIYAILASEFQDAAFEIDPR